MDRTVTHKTGWIDWAKENEFSAFRCKNIFKTEIYFMIHQSSEILTISFTTLFYQGNLICYLYP